jgi:hypothetical protein
MEWPENTQKKLDRQLRFMFDLPRLHRKLLCGLITRQEIAGLFQTYNSIENIILHVTPDTILKQPFTFEEWTRYITLFKENSACDFSFLTDVPVAKAKVLRRKDNVIWDIDYNHNMQERIRKEISKARVTKSVL